MEQTQILLPQVSLYVGDLHSDVNEYDLFGVFSSIVPVAGVHLCRCSETGKSLCYGYVNFFTYLAASNAMAYWNHTYLKGKPIRIMWYERDPIQLKNGIGNLFVKNLDPSINSFCLERIFSPFGPIRSCKVVEEDGRSRGFGFVQFDSDESAAAARTALHGCLMFGKNLYVAKFINNVQLKACSERTPDFTNLYVKNLDESVTESVLKHAFSPYGPISSAVIMRDDTGKSKGFGFVDFYLPEHARTAAAWLSGTKLGSKHLYVVRAEKKAERRKMVESEYSEKSRDPSLLVTGLGSMDDRSLKELFGHYGQVLSAKVVRDENGQSKGYGFVRFSNLRDSENARKMLNGAFVKEGYLSVQAADQERDGSRKLHGSFTKPTSFFRFGSPGLPPLVQFQPLHYPVPFMPNPFQPFTGYGLTGL